MKKDTSYYRILNVYFHEKHRSDVINLRAQQPTAGGWAWCKAIFSQRCQTRWDLHNDIFDKDIGKLAFFTHPFFADCGIKSDDPSDFDTMTAEDFSSTM